ncbi:GGDEF domain-containing protein [Companilactobacillus allii]|uniref:GGDEF domain-containing protein n=1 Tax=Companilactobacillus allii TaxID=1847728 RepID=UPI00208E9AD4|nr:GGDEF domain-containing protein [Companilactobacillus allii]USQ68946.1 GGDEF domain-containing protein [Companilactobacillus allii]
MSNFISNYLTVSDLVVFLITIGLITVITLISYSIEKKVSTASPFFIRLGAHIVETLILIASILVLREVFMTINNGIIMKDAWLYANAQIAVSFYGFLILNNRLVELTTLALPFLYNPSLNLTRLDSKLWPVFIGAYFVLLITVDYVYSHKDEMLVSGYKYTIAQSIYGLVWWTLLWIDYRFNPLNTIISMIFFEIFMFLFRLNEVRLRASFADYKDLEVKANYDALTGVRNRSNLNTVSKEAFDEYHDNNKPLTVAMFDIDHFKNFNDNYGHETGDEVLRHVAHLAERELVSCPDTNGQLFRYGGEEFIVILRDTDVNYATKVVYDIRKTLADIPLFLNGTKLDVTICFGVTKLTDKDLSYKDIFERVDKYLYQSKNSGRNCVTIEGETFSYDSLQAVVAE